MLRKRIVAALVRLRKDKGLSQEKLASRCGLDRTYISGIERMNRNFTVDSLEKIVNALDLSMDEFLKFASNLPKNKK